MIVARDLQKPPSQWTDDERTLIRDTYQQCLDRLEETRAQAHRDGKRLFAKEHSHWLVNPGKIPPPPASNGASANGNQNGNHHDTSDLTSFFRLRFPPPTQDDYSPTNPSLFPDSYLHNWQLAFIIRHPALAWPSMYRAMLKMQTELGMLDEDGVKGASIANMSMAWTRRMVDWAAARHQADPDSYPPPLIMDAHDVIHNPASVLRFCEMAGLDKDAVQFEWGAETRSVVQSWGTQDEKAARIMLATLEASRGVVKEKAPATVDIEAEAVKWREEFGEEAAALVERAVWGAMGDYEYLRERRVQA
jgi:hypothetical protein